MYMRFPLTILLVVLLNALSAGLCVAENRDDYLWDEWLGDDLFNESNLQDIDEIELNALDNSDLHYQVRGDTAFEQGPQDWLFELWQLENIEWGEVEDMTDKQFQAYQQWLRDRMDIGRPDLKDIPHPGFDSITPVYHPDNIHKDYPVPVLDDDELIDLPDFDTMPEHDRRPEYDERPGYDDFLPSDDLPEEFMRHPEERPFPETELDDDYTFERMGKLGEGSHIKEEFEWKGAQ